MSEQELIIDKKIDARKKGLESSAVIPFELISPLVNLPNKDIADKLGYSVHIVKKSLVHHGLYRGKYYTLTCACCQQIFFDFVNDRKFCSNHCKHSKQRIWNKGLTKDDSNILAASAIAMKGNKLGALVNHSIKNTEDLVLPTLNITVTYDKNSSLEKEWLLQIDKNPGVVNVYRSTIKFEYQDEFKKSRYYYPDYEVIWETGLKWLVEIKGIATDLDYAKIEQISWWAKENRFDYRIITTGMVRRDNWNRVYSCYKNIKIPTPEWVMMSTACAWSRLSISPRLQVGVVICSMDYEEQFSYGYNGDEKGGANIPTTLQPGQDGFIHAEENSLLKLKTKDDCKMFITTMPCINCAKRIINAGNIKEVFYLKSYRDKSGVGLLMKHGIKVFNFQICSFNGEVFNEDMAYDHLLPAGLKDMNLSHNNNMSDTASEQ